MGGESSQFDEEMYARCDICDEYIAIDFYLDIGDLVSCEECDAEYIIKSSDPIMLALISDEDDDLDDEDDDFYE